MKFLNKLINSKFSTYILELVLPVIFTLLFYIQMEAKDIYEKDVVAGSFSFLFFFVVVLEWIRRKKDKSDRPYYFRFLYIGLMLIIFVLGIGYANQLPEY